MSFFCNTNTLITHGILFSWNSRSKPNLCSSHGNRWRTLRAVSTEPPPCTLSVLTRHADPVELPDDPRPRWLFGFSVSLCRSQWLFCLVLHICFWRIRGCWFRRRWRKWGVWGRLMYEVMAATLGLAVLAPAGFYFMFVVHWDISSERVFGFRWWTNCILYIYSLWPKWHISEFCSLRYLLVTVKESSKHTNNTS